MLAQWEHLTFNLKIKGSNAATSIGREKLVLVFTHYNTVVDYQTHNLKIKGLNLATGFATEKKTNKSSIMVHYWAPIAYW
jgi:hypothetical protein